MAKIAREMQLELAEATGVTDEEALVECVGAIQVVLRGVLRREGIQGAAWVVDLAIRLALETAFAGADLPFVLFEDLFETEPVMNYEEAWKLIEE